jgi:metal-responsive CopG/Arc/MetJ family transcriptional regulator
MAAARTEKISVMLEPTVLARLDSYAERNRWTRSTAVAVLVERALDSDQGDQESHR